MTKQKIVHGERDWPVLRVEFAEDALSTTSGTGKFLMTWDDADTSYTFDPVPHDRSYFHGHLKAINHYWQTVTDGRITVKSELSQIYPQQANGYELEHTIRYYHRPDAPDSLDKFLAQFVFDAISAAKFSGDFPENSSEIIIYHAGVGQDFDFSNMFDPTPFDLPSFYFDENYMQDNLTATEWAQWERFGVKKGIVVPEMQNQLGINIALNGTEILLSGFLLGLPALYDTEKGISAAGIFGLMDQGSNNAAGLLPVAPSAFERYLLGISETLPLIAGLNALNDGEIGRVNISDGEFYLIEYRQNAGVFFDSLHAELESDSYLETISEFSRRNPDFTWESDSESGVFIGVSDYDITIPASAFLIWHISDPFWEYQQTENPNGAWPPMIRLEEADGAYDIGKNYGILSGDVNRGWKWDMWFADNPAFRDNNPWVFSARMDDNSNPNTRSFAGLSTGISIRKFVTGGSTGTFELILPEETDVYSVPRRIYQHRAFGKMLAFQDSLLLIFLENFPQESEIPSYIVTRTITNPLFSAARFLSADTVLFLEYSPIEKISQISLFDESLKLHKSYDFTGKIDLRSWAIQRNLLHFQITTPQNKLQLVQLNLHNGELQKIDLKSLQPIPMTLYKDDI
ncbi:MAG TPA: hypothetical protein ENN84_03950, partial [Candidatus Marinimicrobia bacterium]|nr:hypothetical protein [Candidatus Neomarinimicrobiota bacterium]